MGDALNTRLADRGLRPLTELASNRPHGDRLRYKAGCKCAECRRANSAYETSRAKARKAGDWNGFVPAARAAQHLQALSQASIGLRQVADASGIARSILVEIRAGTRLTIRARTERSILAVTADAAADRALIDAAPTWKLLDELISTGYSKARLARELDRNSRALQFKRDRCTARNAYNVARLYERLRRVPAARTLKLLAALRAEGHRSSQVTAMVAELAKARGDAPPDMDVYGGFVSAAAADLVEQLHARVTFDPAEELAS